MTTLTINIPKTRVHTGVLKSYIEKNLNNIIFQMELEKDIEEVKKAPKEDFVNL